MVRLVLSPQELQHEARNSLAALQHMEDPFLLLFGEQQEQLLLKSDLWVQVPSLPPRGDSYDVETSFPVANYDSPMPNQRHIGRGVFDEERPAGAPMHFDPPKWEAAPAFLGAAAFGRLIVRGLGDRLQTLRVRFSPVVSMASALPNAVDGTAAWQLPSSGIACTGLKERQRRRTGVAS